MRYWAICFIFVVGGLFGVDEDERQLIRWTAKRNNQVILDVGAHSGEWTDIALECNPKAQFYLFEPALKLHKVLVEKYKNNNRVTLHHLALSNQSQSITLYDPGSVLAGYHFREGIHHAEGAEVVEAMSLDLFCQQTGLSHIDLLKIDTEGAELDILQGAVGLLQSKSIDVIQFEYGGTYTDAGITLKQVYQWVSSFGYKVCRIDKGRVIPIDRWDPRLEDFSLTNYVAHLPHIKF